MSAKVDIMFQASSINNGFADITISVLIKSLFEEDNIKELLQAKDDTRGPLHRIFSVILHPCMNDYYKRYYSFIINHPDQKCIFPQSIFYASYICLSCIGRMSI